MKDDTPLYIFCGSNKIDFFKQQIEKYFVVKNIIVCDNRIINQHTKENDLIFDPFMGSFTTAVACHKLNRNFLGAEIDKDYYKLGSERLAKEQAQVSIFDTVK